MSDDEDVLSLEASSMSEASVEEVDSTANDTTSSNFHFTPADASLLIRLVKLAQKMTFSGAGGTWKEYLKGLQDAPPGTKQPAADPAKHPWNVLADFVESIQGEAARSSIQNLVDWERRRELEEEEELAAQEGDPSGPTAPAQGSIWELVQRTVAHPRFSELYALPAFEEGWQRMRTAPNYDQEPALFAVDCEMCSTTTDDKALLSLCLVDANGSAVLQELVKPHDEVTDFRTAVTGHTADDLHRVRYTRDDAQQDVLGHLAGGAVLIGHALHHDLRALRLDYRPLIDTSLLLTYKDLPESTPALSDLVSRLLGRQLRQPGAAHDVAADARAALDLALYEHQKGPTPPLEPPEKLVPEEDLKRLLIHSLAPSMRDVDLIYIFPSGCPPIVQINRESPQARKAIVEFANVQDATTAFSMLIGKDSTDSIGRAQKQVKVPAGQHKGVSVRVRVLHKVQAAVVGSKRKFDG